MREVSKHYSSQVSNILASVSAMVLGRAEGHNKSKRTVAVDKVSLSINAGEQVGIIGSNGAGKSTLLRMIAGLAPPTSGRLEVQGHVTAVFTLGLGLREDLTGRQNIYANGELQGKDREEIDQVIEKIIEFTDIGEFIDYPLRTYSTGMKSRLAFSMLMHIDPEILIIDEALSAGDGFFIDKAREKMTEICDRGKISIIVSHAMQSIVDMCTRCVWMEDGRVVMDGDPTGVTRAYLGSVRKRDETALVQKVSGHVDAQSLRFGCQIVRFDLKALGRPGSQNIIFSGEDVEFHVGLRVDLTLG
ncbi:MAG: ABC transporter ATP-binding protein, partial [Nitrososphaerales archaeon]